MNSLFSYTKFPPNSTKKTGWADDCAHDNGAGGCTHGDDADGCTHNDDADSRDCCCHD